MMKGEVCTYSIKANCGAPGFKLINKDNLITEASLDTSSLFISEITYNLDDVYSKPEYPYRLPKSADLFNLGNGGKP